MENSSSQRNRLDSCTDEEIVALVLGGQIQAFEIIVRRHGKRLFATALMVLRDEAEAEDIVQDTYVSAYEHLNQFAGRARFSTWLTRIALYKSLAKVSSRTRTQPLEYRDSEGEVRQIAVPDTSPNPEQALADKQQANLLYAAIQSLPDNYRRVVLLREIQGADTQATARRLHITPSNVKVRLHRAHHMLRREFRQDFLPPVSNEKQHACP